MRKLLSIFIFSAALLTGVFSLPINTPTIYEKIYPTFSQNEINSLIGKTVVNKSRIFGMRGWKYPLDDARNLTAEVLRDGETGQVVDLQKVMDGKAANLQKAMKKCGLLVRWNEKNNEGRDMYSCQGRFSSRVYLEFE